MIDLVDFLKAGACIGIFARLYSYKWPSNTRYRVGVTLVAYFLMFCAGAEAITIVLGRGDEASIFDTLLLWSVFALIVASKGNLARVLEVKSGES